MEKLDLIPIQMISMDLIDTKTVSNCRGTINPAECLELSKSIKEHGLLSPIAVIRKSDETDPKPYALIAGFRRWTAHRINKAEEIAAKVLPQMPLEDALTINLMENLDRENLGLMQEATAVGRLQNLSGLNPKEIGKKLSKSLTWVNIRLACVGLETEIQNEIDKGYLTQKNILELTELPTSEARFNAVKQLKSAKFRGEKIKIIPKKYKQVIKPFKREKAAINELQDHIVQSLGSGYFSKLPQSAKYLMKVLGWAAGEEVSDMDVYNMLREIAIDNELYYEIPLEDRAAISTI